MHDFLDHQQQATLFQGCPGPPSARQSDGILPLNQFVETARHNSKIQTNETKHFKAKLVMLTKNDALS